MKKFAIIILLILACSNQSSAKKQTSSGANSSQSKVIKELKTQMHDPSSFELVEFDTYFSQGIYEVYYIRFRANNPFGGKMLQDYLVYYYQGSFCGAEVLSPDIVQAIKQYPAPSSDIIESFEFRDCYYQ